MVLGLTFTKGMTLSTWVENGLFEREKLIYEEHLKQGHFDKIYWFTYGHHDDAIRNRLVSDGRLDGRIEVVPAPWYGEVFVLRWLYSINMHIVNKKICKTIDIFKTNQMGGAWSVALIARKYKKFFVLRTGYTYSSFIKNRKAKSIYDRIRKRWVYAFYRKVEKNLYKTCDLAEVSSKHDIDYISNAYNIATQKIKLLHNYIDCDKFSTNNDNMTERITDRILFVGRIDTQKNLREIIKSAKGCNIGLDIYGKGPLKEELEIFSCSIGADVRFMGVRPNDELPDIYRSYRYYILASIYEGMPKTLLEAMACGCVCLGTNVEGIEEVIIDGKNGFLASDTSSSEIAATLKKMLAYSDYKSISNNAVDYINKNFSLNGVTEQEWSNIQKLLP